ncbi:sce7726 family protein [Paraburkholderia caledonica]|uniref:Sce7726 family protein n=1 Tax=Paraburkholderia caledonica TaxID=134536 RepID=A0AB73IM79_9BURK|nr:hypothetical protein [Paraburkholderia caledonica]
MSHILNERRIRALLTRHIKRSDWRRTDTLIPEYFVERAARRADLVAVNGHLKAYEIKSDLDQLSRLAGQIEVYSRYFESVTVVCTRKHLDSVVTRTDAAIGVMCVSDEGFEYVRAARQRDIDVDAWLSHLPITAIREALKCRGIRCPRVDRAEVLAVARGCMSALDARSTVFTYLKTEKRKQRVALSQRARVHAVRDPLEEHRAMLREYIDSRGIAMY